MPKHWKIKQGNASGGKDAVDLIGCEIRENDAGTGYEFIGILAKTPGNTLPTPPFSFPSFSFDNYTWTITVNTLAGGPQNNEGQGTWTNNDPTIADEESGTWTAQAGSGTGEEGEEDAAAASA